ncbi:unnamed protein product [Caenorhabditis auriculariae]|uniref:Uncharacterized protein n=1 Tax=Caenorhabditis auriculariae TaxID=2777116 RepID=A0A8S1GVC7_9PELO|nr:unnamed protein product [Caenorhabditis auriculariae]
MCITFIHVARTTASKYKLVVLNNRDEFFDRPSAKMDWREGVLSGIDEQDAVRGTWFGVNRTGKVGMLLSVTQPAHTKFVGSPSRGSLVKNYLKASTSLNEYCEQLIATASSYNGFQFVGLERNSHGLYELRSVTNRLVDEVKTAAWPPGDYCISNSPASCPYQKAIYGERIFKDAMKDVDNLSLNEVVDRLLVIATDHKKCLPDPQIALQTEMPEELHGPIGSIFVRYDDSNRYGTRTHSVLVVDNQDNVFVFERRMTFIPENVSHSSWEDCNFEFQLEK